MTDPKRILVIRQDRIGDVVCTTPLIRGLRQTFPDAFIAALVQPRTKPVLENNPHLNAVLTDDWEGADAGKDGYKRVLAVLRSYEFDTGLLPLPSERHAKMMLAARMKTRISTGTRPYLLLTGTKTVSRNKYIPLRHEADYCLDLGRKIGVESDDLREEVFVTEAEKAKASELLRSLGFDPSRPVISIHPESGRSSPNWLPATYARLAKELLAAQPDLQVMVNITPGNSEARQPFERIDSPNLFLPNNAGSLRTLMGLMTYATCVISSSTGPMHLAAGLGIPTISLFCPLPACHPDLWGPRGNDATIVMASKSYCDTHCADSPHTCNFDDISVERVKGAVQEKLAAALDPNV